MIASRRVSSGNTHQDLPERFQTAEFLEEHGLIDMIVHRKKIARADQPLAQLFHCRAVNRAGGSQARWTGKPVRVGASGDVPINYREALGWL